MTKLVVTPSEYVEIMNLYAALNHASDEGEADAYAACFTENGELYGTHEVKGREALAAWKRKDKATRTQLYRRHWNGSIHLEKLDSTTIRGRAYLLAYNGEPGHVPHITHAGVYADTIKQVDGTWKFAVRRLSFDAKP